jgi:phosphatidate cytidylyltransferase
MLTQRILVVLVLLPIGITLILVGGLPYDLFMTLVLALSGWEYARMFRKAGWQPGMILVVASVTLLALVRSFFSFQYVDWIFCLLVMLSMAYHLFQFEKGRDQAAIDFCITLGGILYLGWLGSYLISVRSLTNGMWWILLVLPTVWSADVGAYFIGSHFGKHLLAPRLSPKKTWEGYFAGVISGTLGGMLIAYLISLQMPGVALGQGALLGFLLGVLTPLGDLGESMLKRMAGVKDSSQLLPGHGGVFDRIDSWIWAVVIGFYLIQTFWLG